MLNYEDLPEDIKVMYSKEQCDQIIKLADKLSIVVGNVIESIRCILAAIQPSIQEFAKKCNDIIKTMEVIRKVETYNIKPKYPPYKPKIKRVMVYRKPIYYHIRSNC